MATPCVLIETLWNVKSHASSNISICTPVLIETLWNVKSHMVLACYPDHAVLIETLWNVKDVEISHYLNGLLRINRNIVECKEW